MPRAEKIEPPRGAMRGGSERLLPGRDGGMPPRPDEKLALSC
jgi:hypothetical protein